MIMQMATHHAHVGTERYPCEDPEAKLSRKKNTDRQKKDGADSPVLQGKFMVPGTPGRKRYFFAGTGSQVVPEKRATWLMMDWVPSLP